MNWLIEPFKQYRACLLSTIGLFASYLVIYANFVMYRVNIPNSGVSFVDAQRLWTKGLLLCILYLSILLLIFYRWRLNPKAIVTMLYTQLLWIRLIFANAIFLTFIAVPIVINMCHIFSKPITISKTFPQYYWFCVFMGIVTFFVPTVISIINKLHSYIIKSNQVACKVTIIFFCILTMFFSNKVIAKEIKLDNSNYLDITGRISLASKITNKDIVINDLGSRINLRFSSYSSRYLTARAFTAWKIGTQDIDSKNNSFLTNYETYIQLENDIYGKLKVGKFTNIISNNTVAKTDKAYVAKLNSGITKVLIDNDGSNFAQNRLRQAIAYENHIGIINFGLQGQGNQKNVYNDAKLVDRKYSLGWYVGIDTEIFSIACGSNKVALTNNKDIYQNTIGSAFKYKNYYLGASSAIYNDIITHEINKSWSIYTHYQFYQFKPYFGYEEILDKSRQYVWGLHVSATQQLWIIYEGNLIENLNNNMINNNNKLNQVHSIVIRYTI